MEQGISVTMGIDLGDRRSHYYALECESGEVERGSVSTTRKQLTGLLEGRARMRVVVETCGQSAWVAELATELGHEVIVAQASKLRAIYAAYDKCDQVDAEKLARLGRVDPGLLAPIRHRGLGTQRHLALLRARDALVQVRTKLINTARGLVKVVGERLPSCSAASFHHRVSEVVPESLRAAIDPVVEMIKGLTGQIRGLDREVERLGNEVYPQTARLRQVAGVGPLTALAYVLTLEDSRRFAKSRTVGAYLGLVPRRDQSGAVDRQLGITKAGDHFLRRTLVQAAHYVLGPFGPDTDLRRWGLKLCERGGKSAKRRAIVAVARRLAVLLHRLWVSGERYEPLRARAA